MKQIRPMFGGLVACSILVATAMSLAAQTVQQGLAKVVNIKGSARYMTKANPTWQPLRVGTVLRAGAILQTASGSYVDLVLNNPNAARTALSTINAARATPVAASGGAARPGVRQDAVRAFENTVLGLDKLTLEQTGVETISHTELDLKAGSILGTVKKLTTGSDYKIKIPNGVAGIRGTIYRLTADGQLSVISGSVVLVTIGPDGKPITKVINMGMEYDSRTGKETRILPAIFSQLNNMSKELAVGPTAFPQFAKDWTFIPVSIIR